MFHRCHTVSSLKKSRQALAAALVGLGCVAASLPTAALAVSPPKPAQTDFTGTWSVTWCDKARPTADCGGFTVFLFQQGQRLCGSHHGATVGLSRLDEGAPRSIVGAVTGKQAVMTVHSTRASETGTLFLATAQHLGSTLKWRIAETVLGDNADHVVAQQANLRRQATDENNEAWQATRDACAQSFQ